MVRSKNLPLYIILTCRMYMMDIFQICSTYIHAKLPHKTAKAEFALLSASSDQRTYQRCALQKLLCTGVRPLAYVRNIYDLRCTLLPLQGMCATKTTFVLLPQYSLQALPEYSSLRISKSLHIERQVLGQVGEPIHARAVEWPRDACVDSILLPTR